MLSQQDADPPRPATDAIGLLSCVNTTPMSSLGWSVPEQISSIVKDSNCRRAVQHYLCTGWHVSVRAGRFDQVMFKYDSRSQPNTADSECQYSPVLCCRFLVAMSSKCQLPVRLPVSFWWNQSLISDRRAAARMFRLMPFSAGIFSFLSQSLWLHPGHFRVSTSTVWKLVWRAPLCSRGCGVKADCGD